MHQAHDFPDIAATQALQREAARVSARLVKRCARSYADCPQRLDVLCPGLSEASPAALIEIAKDLMARERRAARRWFGFGSEVAAINARALILLGRARRRRFPFDFRGQHPLTQDIHRSQSADAPDRPI